MAAVRVDEERRVEDLERLMRVERDDGLREDVEVAVQKRAEALRVVHCARARPPGHEELEARRAERVLHVHEQEAGAKAVLGGTPDVVLGGPGDGVAEARLVVDLPDVPDAFEVCVRGQG